MPILIYDSEMSTIIKKELSKLRIFEEKIFQKPDVIGNIKAK